MVSTSIKLGEQGEPEHEIKIRFHGLLEMSRHSKNSELFAKLK